MQEGAIMVQLCYFPMLLLSGAFIPESAFRGAIKRIHDFVPATYLVRGMHSMLQEGGTLQQNWLSALALFVTIAVGGFVSIKLFRWEKGEKIRGSAKLWVVVALLPFVVLGVLAWING
jgi:ABC-type multidrug transport system permease subunit